MNSIHLFYVSPRDIRKNRSDAVHIMLSCSTFANNGLQVTLLTPNVIRDDSKVSVEEIFDLYRIKPSSFKIIELSPKQTEKDNDKYFHSLLNAVKKFLGHLFFILNHFKHLRSPATIIYSKCFISTIPYILIKKIRLIKSIIVFEVITPKKSRLHRFIFRNVDIIISMLRFVTQDIINYYVVNEDKIFEPPMVTQSKEILAVKETKEQLRKFFGFDENKVYILYAGKTGDKVKEVDYFIDTAKIVNEFEFIIVGANKKAQEKYTERINKENIRNLHIIPFQPLTNYYRYVLASDILVGYYPATYHNKYHLSPGKSGIYLASKNPCIFSDLPSLRSIFPDQTVFYAKPDDPVSLAEIIRYVHDNKTLAEMYSKNAFKFAINHTYENFAAEILNFILNSKTQFE